MKHFIKKYWPHIACVVIWALVTLLTFILSQGVSANASKQQEKASSIELVGTTKTDEEVSPMLLTSIDLFVTEEERLIAEGVRSAAIKYKIPSYVIFAIIAAESNHYGTKDINDNSILKVNSHARSIYDCIGLMQVSQYAVDDYNKINGTDYTLNDMYRVKTNIEVGTWYYSQFSKVAFSYTEMYVIYNVGYGNYKKTNHYWFYDYNGTWHNDYKNSFFYMNNLMPPHDSNHGMCGRNSLSPYNAKKRFEKCLSICHKKFN